MAYKGRRREERGREEKMSDMQSECVETEEA